MTPTAPPASGATIAGYPLTRYELTLSTSRTARGPDAQFTGRLPLTGAALTALRTAHAGPETARIEVQRPEWAYAFDAFFEFAVDAGEIVVTAAAAGPVTMDRVRGPLP